MINPTDDRGAARPNDPHRRPAVSFVVPARNEGDLITDTLRAIRTAVDGAFEYEIVLVDNASTDATASLAAAEGAKVISVPTGTIASLRNAGVRASSGAYLVFLDADVRVSRRWGERFPSVMARLGEHPTTLTGSMTMAGSQGAWLERYWFAAREHSSFSHIGSAHLIVTRAFFDQLGGFNEDLATGEDFDFSQRALRAGGRIEPDDQLVAAHCRYPETIGEFIAREAWHGQSDFVDLKAVLASRVAIAALVFTLAHIAVAFGIIFGVSPPAIVGAGLIASVCFGSSLAKYRARGWRFVAVNTLVFYLYYVGRSLSVFREVPALRRRWGRR